MLLGTRSSEKADIFSYGVILWEIITGAAAALQCTLLAAMKNSSSTNTSWLVLAGHTDRALSIASIGESPHRGRMRALRYADVQTAFPPPPAVFAPPQGCAAISDTVRLCCSRVPEECSAGVADLVRQCMEHTPARRPSAEQVPCRRSVDTNADGLCRAFHAHSVVVLPSLHECVNNMY